MLARRLPGILPEMTTDESLEVTRIYSVAGLLGEDASLITTPPFRSPHHSTSLAGLIGGGSGLPASGRGGPRAHRESSSWTNSRCFAATCSKRCADRSRIAWCGSRAADGHVTFPCNFALVAAMNPCPCGHLGDNRRACKCRESSLAAHRARVSGPLLDRFDIFVMVNPLDKDEILGLPTANPPSTVRARVDAARARQLARYGDKATMNTRGRRDAIEAASQLSRPIRARLARAIDESDLSARRGANPAGGAHDRRSRRLG